MYYLIINQKQAGPFADDKLIEAGMTPDTYVWTTGMPDWKKASEVAALQPILNAHFAAAQEPTQQPQFQQPQQPQQPNYGAQPNYGSQQPNYGPQQQPNYGPQQPYGPQQYNPYGQPPRKASMMTASVIATVFGLCSCIGLILGILAIVRCNKANNFYAVGDDMRGDEANNSARSLAIGAFIFDAIGLILTIVNLGTILAEL
jgi:hypothetical protein